MYLDHNATTPLRPEVAEAMAEVLREEYGNPSSVYAEGAAARARVEAARAEVAALLGARPADVRFTSGATEANNTVIAGLLGPGDHVVTSAVEHPSVDAPLRFLESRPGGGGLRVTRVAPDATGRVEAEAIAAAIRPETRLVTLIWANNETGAIQPVESVASVCRERGVTFHSDATQAVAKTEVDLRQVPCDFVSCSAHKLGGPKGVGALVGADNARLAPLLRGGGQERGLRGGTENVASIVGFGVACALARKEGEARAARARTLRDRLWAGLQRELPGVGWNGDPAHTLGNTLNVRFAGVEGEVLVQALDLEGVAVSAGAACHSGAIEPSGVLLAMGLTPQEARGSLRFSTGAGLSEADIDRVITLLRTLVPRVQAGEGA
ncbi:MAG: cysteine desulfurase family protein [Myxococcota bacterium]|nr:cysteine desulfurase [Myxococcales bacterium]